MLFYILSNYSGFTSEKSNFLLESLYFFLTFTIEIVIPNLYGKKSLNILN